MLPFGYEVQKLIKFSFSFFVTVCFKVFDIDRDGVLNFDEIQEMIDILIQVSKESPNSENYKHITAEKILLELCNRVNKTAVTDNSNVRRINEF